MDELTLAGKTYISSKRAAKQYRYTTDYIGQLCRGGKLECQRVGRAWYVSESSIAEHHGGEAVGASAIPVPEEQAIVPASEVHAERLVNGAPHAVTIHSIHALGHKHSPSFSGTWSDVRYLEDDAAPIPLLSKPVPARENNDDTETSLKPRVIIFESREDEKPIEERVVSVHREPLATHPDPHDVSAVRTDGAMRTQAGHKRHVRRARASIMPLFGSIALIFLFMVGLLSFQTTLSYSQGSLGASASIATADLYESFSRYLVNLGDR